MRVTSQALYLWDNGVLKVYLKKEAKIGSFSPSLNWEEPLYLNGCVYLLFKEVKRQSPMEEAIQTIESLFEAMSLL